MNAVRNCGELAEDQQLGPVFVTRFLDENKKFLGLSVYLEPYFNKHECGKNSEENGSEHEELGAMSMEKISSHHCDDYTR